MAKRSTGGPLGGAVTPRRRRAGESPSSSFSPVEESSLSSSSASSSESVVTRAVNSVFNFVRLAEFEILFVLFFLAVFILFKDLTSRPEYNQILVKKPGGPDWWP